MGVVFRARDPELGRDIAVKVLQGDGRVGSTGSSRQVLQEARAAAGLSHPNIVEVLDVGVHEGRAYVAMELVDGCTLAEWALAHPPGSRGRWRDIASLLAQAARGLAAAHAVGVIHRDVKPANMLIGRDGRLRLADFGLARATTDEADTDGNAEPRSASETNLAGTVAYMAPERFERRPASAQSDQFALCVSFWEVAYGERPFDAPTAAALARVVAERAPITPRGGELPRWLHRVLLRGLQKRPEDRFPSLDTMVDALSARRNASRSWRRASLVGGFAGVGVTVVLALASEPDPPCARIPDELARAWDDTRRAQTDDALRAVVPTHADILFDTISSQVDTRIEAWSRSWHDNCVATRLAGTQSEADHDRRALCLDRMRVAIVALTSDPTRAPLDAEDARAMVNASMRLPNPTECDDVARLAGAPPLPEDPVARAEVARLEGMLAAWQVTAYARPMEASLAALDELSDRVDATGHLPLMARAAGHRADLFAHAGRPETIALRERSLDLAERAGLDSQAAEEAANLFGDMRRLGHSQESARAYLRKAEALAARVTDPEERARTDAFLAVFQAEQCEADGDHECALARRHERLAHLERTEGPDRPITAIARKELGMTLVRLGRLDEAEPLLLEAHAAVLRHRPPDLTAEAGVVSALGIFCVNAGRKDDAVRHARRLAELTAAHLGEDHPMRVRVISQLGAALSVHGDHAEAIEAFSAALELADRVLPESDPQRVTARLHLAREIEDRATRLELLAAARDLALVHHGAESFHYGHAMYSLGVQAWQMEDGDLALASLGAAIPVLEAHGRRAWLADARAYVAMVHADRGDLDTALEHAQASLDLALAERGGSEEKLALPYLSRAYVRRARGATNEARADLELARSAVQGYATRNVLVTRIERLATEMNEDPREDTRDAR